jgi:two-component system NtrC family sensor kinase
VNTSHRKSVVIVDDDKFYTKLLTQLLAENLDRPVIAFLHPREALEALPRLNAGVIVTDYEMPELNGFEFMAEAAKLVPSANFIVITGHPITAAMEKKLSASPAKSVLSKPFTWRKLCDEIICHWPTMSLNPFGANPTPVTKPASVANRTSV